MQERSGLCSARHAPFACQSKCGRLGPLDVATCSESPIGHLPASEVPFLFERSLEHSLDFYTHAPCNHSLKCALWPQRLRTPESGVASRGLVGGHPRVGVESVVVSWGSVYDR
jgi:hypothetical protein